MALSRLLTRAFLLAFCCTALTRFVMCSGTGENPLVGSSDDVIPPATPSGLDLPSVGNGEISVSWNANTETDFKGYKLYRAENSTETSAFNLVFDSESTSYVDTDLEYSTSYNYRVSAYDIAGNESEWSDRVEGQPFNTHAPSIPQNLTVFAENLGAPFFEISWNPNSESDLRGYKIYRDTKYNFSKSDETFIDSVLVYRYTDSNVDVDSVYYYKVLAYDKGGKESLTTEPVSDVALSPPVLLAPADNVITSNLPTFTWQAVDNTLGYKIIVQTSSQGGEIWFHSVSNDSTSIQYGGTAELESGKTYYWKVATITKDADRFNSVSNIYRFRIQ